MCRKRFERHERRTKTNYLTLFPTKFVAYLKQTASYQFRTAIIQTAVSLLHMRVVGSWFLFQSVWIHVHFTKRNLTSIARTWLPVGHVRLSLKVMGEEWCLEAQRHLKGCFFFKLHRVIYVLCSLRRSLWIFFEAFVQLYYYLQLPF